MRSRAAGLDPPSVPPALRRWVLVGRTSFVDFCKRDVPRARPRFVRTPLHRAPGRPCAQLLPDHARRFRDVRAPGLRVAARLVRRRALARRREDPCAGLPGVTFRDRLRDRLRPRTTRFHAPSVEADPGPWPAEKSRVRGRARILVRGSCRLLATRSLAPQASPQPDRLEHLLSRARRPSPWSPCEGRRLVGAVGFRVRAHRASRSLARPRRL